MSEPEKHETGNGAARDGNGHWQKGHSGNPNGKPKNDVSLTTLLKAQLIRPCPGDKQGRTWREVLVLAWLTGAMKNPMLLKELVERVDGRVMQPVGGENGGPLTIKVVYEQPKG